MVSIINFYVLQNRPSFLLIKDKTWRGERPFRTYYGFKYEGGYSDHLPLIVDFLLLK